MEQNNGGNQPEQGKGGARKRLWLIIGIVVAVLLLAAVGAFAWVKLNEEKQYERYEFDTAAMAGRIQQMTEEEIQAELDRVVEEGMFNISIASAIVFPSPDSEGEARIENIAANRYHMQVDITLDETGEKVYSSKLIQPGYSIANIKLNRRLEPGEYPATAMFSAITQDELKLFGQAAALINLYVMPEPTPTPTPSPVPTSTPAPTAAAAN